MLLKLSYATIPLFWPIWILAAAVIGYVACRSHNTWTAGDSFEKAGVGATAIAVFLIPYVAFLLWSIDFAYHDDDSFIEFTVSGLKWPLAIWPYLGRYFPLQLQEFNLLALVSPTPGVYYAFVVAQLIVFCWLLLQALADVPVVWRVVGVVVLLTSNSVGIVFAEPVYPERNIVVSLAVLAVLLPRIDRAPSRLNLFGALLAAHVALYCKEPVFLLVATMALTRLWRGRSRHPASRWRWLTECPLEIGCLVLCALFVGQFLVSLLAFANARYVANASVGPLRAASYYAQTDPLLWAFVATIAVRARSIVRGECDPVWDALAAGAGMYFAALVLLGLAGDRYMPPVDLIAMLLVVRQAARHFERFPSHRWVIAALTALVALASISLGAFRLWEHKSVVRGTVELRSSLERYGAARTGAIHLFFPDSEGWRIMNFAAHLRYRAPEVFARVHLRAPKTFADGQCVFYFSRYRCETSLLPGPGDVVVHLPDDATYSAVEGPRTVFAHAFLPDALPLPLCRWLYRGTPLAADHTMPPHWLTATVAVMP